MKTKDKIAKKVGSPRLIIIGAYSYIVQDYTNGAFQIINRHKLCD